MKKLRILLGTTLSVSIVMMTPMAVFAVTGSGSDGTGSTSGSDSSTSTTTSTDSTTEVESQKPEDVAKRAAELKKRLEENKSSLKTKLDEASKKRISGKCKASQTIVKGAETSADAISTNRGKAYAKIAEKIQTLIDKVKAQGIDTTALEAANATAKQKAETLAASMATYKQTLTDLRSMDCAADPTAFQATLEKARTQREAVKTQAQDLRTYISVTLKAAISDVRKQLEPTETETQKPEDTKTTNTTTPTTTGGTR